MTVEEHRKFLEQDFDDVKIEELKDISRIRIDRGRTVEEKKRQYLGKVGNPYLVKVGGTMVGRLENAVLSCTRTMAGMVSEEVSAVIDRVLVYSEERIEIVWKTDDWFFIDSISSSRAAVLYKRCFLV